MPTYGWIREDALDAFYEGTQRVPDPGSPPNPTFPCPFCPRIFQDRRQLQGHVSADHHVERPVILIGGHEAERRTYIRSRRVMGTVDVANATSAKLARDGTPPRSVAVNELPQILSEDRYAEFLVELSNDRQARATPAISTYEIVVRIAKPAELRAVERAFSEIVMGASLSLSTIDHFLSGDRCKTTGFEYAQGLAEYCLGVILKERPETETLTTTFARYRDAYGAALQRLADIERPLARLVCSIIRFAMNDFSKAEKATGFWELDLANGLFHDPSGELATQDDDIARTPICPIDHGIDLILNLAATMSKHSRWSPILAEECRNVASSQLLDAFDRQKALAVWALAAWKLGAKENAIEPLRQISATFPFRVWAEPYLESVTK